MGNVNMEASQIHYRGGNRPMSVEEALKEGGGGSLNLEVIAPTFSETAQYLEGDLVFYDDTLYRFDADHDPGAWDSTEVMETNIAENLVMFPGDGLRRTIHTYDLKLQSGGGLAFDANGALYTNVVHNFNTNEQPTGQKWIDGKDIYFRVVSLDTAASLASNQWVNLGIDIPIETGIQAFAIADDGTNVPVCMAYDSAVGVQVLSMRTATVSFKKFVLYYTKITV